MRVSFAEAGLKDFPCDQLESRLCVILTRISNFLAEWGIEAYVVGGLVRDMLLERDTVDIDFSVGSDALEVAPRVAAALGGKYVLLDRVNRVGRVVLVDDRASSPEDHWELDFATFRGNVEQDLARRDFTIDAMAFDLNQFKGDFSDVQLVDPFNGWDDLRKGVLRAVSETVFESDAVRLLRAVRLATELGFRIDKKTKALIRRYSNLVVDVAGERVREEMLRLLAISGGGQFIACLDELGLLTAVFPELVEAKGVDQPTEHFWNVYDHSLKTVIAVDFLLGQGVWEYANQDVLAAVPWSEVLDQHFAQRVSGGSTKRSLLTLAALLHDVAKPQTKTRDTSGRIRFLGHAQEGAVIVANMLERLRFSAKEVKLVETAVRYHLRPGQMSRNELPTHRAIYRYFRDTGEAGIDILFLSLADHLAARGPHLKLSHWREHAQVVDYVLSRRFEQENIVHPPKLVDGHDLISIFGMSPGPRIGEILEAVREAQASGELTTRQEIIAYIHDRLLAKVEC
ncbi:CCA tRNA nucleotidyltransferase [Chloroflexota bacterium]